MKLTEKIVADLLRARHASKSGNGPEWAFAAQVRNDAGFDAKRTFDAVAIHLWPSRGLPLHVFEIKVSRSDWQRELSKPDKAEDACKVADHFWIVAPKGCVKNGELPDEWGLIEVGGEGTDESPWRLRTVKTAPKLHDRRSRYEPLPRGLVVGMLRSTPGACPGGIVPASTRLELDEARRAGFEEGVRSAEFTNRHQHRAGQEAVEQIAQMREALRAAGLENFMARPETIINNADAVVRGIRGQQADERLRQAAIVLRNAVELIEGMDS